MSRRKVAARLWSTSALLLAGLLPTCGCVSIPDTYRPPIERRPMVGDDTSDLGHLVHMGDPDAGRYIIADISPTVEASAWRWTGERPALRFRLPDTRGWKLLMEFTVVEDAFRETGPFHVTFSVNGRVLDRVRYDSPGQKLFEKEVPSEWLRPNSLTVVTAELDKAYVADADKKKLGVVLARAGFLR